MDRDLIAKQSFHGQKNGDQDIRKKERTEGAIALDGGGDCGTRLAVSFHVQDGTQAVCCLSAAGS